MTRDPLWDEYARQPEMAQRALDALLMGICGETARANEAVRSMIEGPDGEPAPDIEARVFAAACGWAGFIKAVTPGEGTFVCDLSTLPGRKPTIADVDRYTALAAFITAVGNEDTAGAFMTWVQLSGGSVADAAKAGELAIDVLHMAIACGRAEVERQRAS